MSANLSGNDIANGDFMIKTCAADPEGGYAKEKFHADPKNGIIISEVDGSKGKRLEFSADWSVVSLDTKLQEGENIEISEDPVTGKTKISAPDVGKVKTDSGDTFNYFPTKIEVGHNLSKRVNNSTHKLEIDYEGAVVSRCELATFNATEVDDWYKLKGALANVFDNAVTANTLKKLHTLVAFRNLMGLENKGCDCKIRIYYVFEYSFGETPEQVTRNYQCSCHFLIVNNGMMESEHITENIVINFTASDVGAKYGIIEIPCELHTGEWINLSGSIYAKDGEEDTTDYGDLKILAVEYIHYGYNISETDIDI